MKFFDWEERFRFCSVCRDWKCAIESIEIQEKVCSSELPPVAEMPRIGPLFRNFYLDQYFHDESMDDKFISQKCQFLSNLSRFAYSRSLSPAYVLVVKSLLHGNQPSLKELWFAYNPKLYAHMFCHTCFPCVTKITLEVDESDLFFLEHYIHVVFPALEEMEVWDCTRREKERSVAMFRETLRIAIKNIPVQIKFVGEC